MGGLVASYCHPIEMLLSNAMPLTFGAIVFRVHAFTVMVWTGFAVLGTNFTIVATACPGSLVWSINQTSTITTTRSSIAVLATWASWTSFMGQIRSIMHTCGSMGHTK